MKIRALILTALTSVVVFSIPVSTYAIPAITPGLTVSPAIKQLSLAKNQKQLTFNALVTNNTKERMAINISTTDFTAVNEKSGIEFLPNLTNRPHGLAQWLKPTISDISLDSGKSQTVPIVITPDSALAPGGHYGALVYKVIATGSAQNGNLISNNEAVSTLVFLTTSSGSTQTVSLGSLPLNKITLSVPTSVNLVLSDSGNTQTTPEGIVSIVNSSKKEVARGIINPESGLILPGTSRLYRVPLTKTGNTSIPGTYRMIVDFQASGSSTTKLYTAQFLLISSRTIVALVILGVLILLFITRKFSTNVIKTQRKP